MTTLNSVITFNASTGSDSAASGCGPATALTGTGAATTGASAVVTGISTTGVTAGDLLWVLSSSGRQFSVIASVDSATQVTCDDVFDNTESGRTWAIGGKRATFDDVNSRQFFYDAPRDCIIETETDQTLSSSLYIGTPRYYVDNARPYTICIKGDASLISSGNFSCITTNVYSPSSVMLCDFKFVGSVGNTSWAINGGQYLVYNCQFGDDGAATNFRYGVNVGAAYSTSSFYKCKFYGQGRSVSGSVAVSVNTWNSGIARMTKCFAKDYATGFNIRDGNTELENCIVTDCNTGVSSNRSYPRPRKCIFHNIYGDAVVNYGYNNESENGLFQQLTTDNFNENIFSNVSGYIHNAPSYTGIPSASSVQDAELVSGRSYCFNSTGGLANGYSDIVTLTESPFVNPDSGDFTINNIAGGGQIIRSLERTI